jgi:hypothetical protein
MITVDPEFFARSVLIKATILAFVLSVYTLFVFKIPVTSGLVFGSLLDISTFFIILKGLKEFIRSKSLKTIALAVVLRGIIKVIILFIAVFNPSIFNFWTASIGILIVEITIVLEAIRLCVFGKISTV